jgi:hypothetical protein
MNKFKIFQWSIAVFLFDKEDDIIYELRNNLLIKIEYEIFFFHANKI